jgi:phage-related protein
MRHGSLIQVPFMQSRSLSVSGRIHSSSADTSYTQLMAMQQALLAGENNFYYRSDRYIKCYAKSIKPEFEPGTDKAVINVDVSLVAQDPFHYSAGASYSSVDNAVYGTTLSFSLYNGGNVFSEPKFTFFTTGGTIFDGIRLYNLTTGKEFRYRGTVASGVSLAIDISAYEVLVAGVDGLSYFDGDFMTLAAGTNSMQFVGSTVRITSEWKYRWS